MKRGAGKKKNGLISNIKEKLIQFSTIPLNKRGVLQELKRRKERKNHRTVILRLALKTRKKIKITK